MPEDTDALDITPSFVDRREPKGACKLGTFLSIFETYPKSEWQSVYDYLTTGNGTYSISEQNISDSVCKPCPRHVLCNGGLEYPMPSEGYTVNYSATQGFQLEQCLFRYLCPGGAFGVLSCRNNFTGKGCTTCAEGLILQGNECVACPQTAAIDALKVLYDIVRVFGLATFALLVTRPFLFFSAVGISFMFLQCIALFSTYPTEYAPHIQSIFLQSHNVFFHWDLGDLVCVLKKTVFEGSQFMLILPILSSCVIAAFLAAKLAYSRLFKKEINLLSELLSVALDRWIGASLYILVLLNKSLIRSTFTVMKCNENSLKMTLCSFDDIVAARLPYVYLGLMWIGMTPLLLLFLGFKNRRFFDDEQVCRRYGSIYKPYREEFWLFAIYRMAWGLLFAYIPILNEVFSLGLSPLVINSLGLVLLQGHILAGMYCQPFRFQYNNKLWVILLTFLCIIFISGSGYMDDTMSTLLNEMIRYIVYLVIGMCVHAVVLERHHSQYIDWVKNKYMEKILESKVTRYVLPLRLENKRSVSIFHNIFVKEKDWFSMKEALASSARLQKDVSSFNESMR
jgi:hypothetical protein